MISRNGAKGKQIIFMKKLSIGPWSKMYRLSPNIRLRDAREYGITNDATSDQKACNFEYMKGICKKCQQYFEVTNHDFRLSKICRGPKLADCAFANFEILSGASAV